VGFFDLWLFCQIIRSFRNQPVKVALIGPILQNPELFKLFLSKGFGNGGGHLAFIMHSLSWLASNGTAAIVCFPGIMYRGGAEQKIRKYLIDNNFIDCIIQLPSNLFFGTSIATCIMVLKKGKSDNKTLFIDASNECIKVTNNNKLTQANMDRIVETFAQRKEEAHFSHMASYEEIAGNDYNLSVSTYVEAEDTREKIDIVKLNAEIEQIVARQHILRVEIDKIIAEIEGGK
jgi:type I restriction enzyme M protein